MIAEIPLTAKAVVLHKAGHDYVLQEDYPVKQPSELAPGECLIKLDYSGVCHSDVHIRNGDLVVKSALPLVGGHEGVGHIVAIGEHSNSSHAKVGDRVGVKWIGGVCMKYMPSSYQLSKEKLIHIDSCEMCRQGHEACAKFYRIYSFLRYLSNCSF